MKKDRVVGIIKHASGVETPLMFNPNDSGDGALTFSASVLGNHVTARSADEVRAKVRAILDHHSEIDWVPVISIDESHPFGTRDDLSYIGLSLDRYYVGLSEARDEKGQRQVRKLSWDLYHAETESSRSGKPLNLAMRRIQDSARVYGWLTDDIARSLPRYDTRSSDRHTLLPYSEEAWSALNAITDGIAAVKIRLREILNTNAGNERLLEMGRSLVKLLPENL